jgi:hypothetical protein
MIAILRRPWTLALLLALTSAACLVIADGAKAAVTIKAYTAKVGTKSRLVVNITSTKSFTRTTKPRGVKVRAGVATYTLTRAAGTAKTSRWQTPASASFNNFVGKHVSTIVRSLARTTTTTRTVTAPPSGGGGGTSLFGHPSRELMGQAAWDYIKGYFLDSRFASATGSYNHCAGGQMVTIDGGFSAWEGSFQRHGSAGNETQTYKTVIQAGHNPWVRADGSWIITVGIDPLSSNEGYLWRVAADGTVEGDYNPPSSEGGRSVSLPRLKWQRGAGC